MDASQAPEVVPSQEAPEVYYGKDRDFERFNKRIFGLRLSTFWLLLVLFVVIVAAAIGGGVSGSMAVKNAKSQVASDKTNSSGTPTSSSFSSTTASTTSGSSSTPNQSSMPATTISGAFVVPTNVMLPLECDKTQPTVTVDARVWKFNATCGVDHPKGDLLPIVSYSLRDCLSACAKYNSKWGDGGCAGVVFAADLAAFVARSAGNCFLKNSTSSDEQADGVVSAVLLGSV